MKHSEGVLARSTIQYSGASALAYHALIRRSSQPVRRASTSTTRSGGPRKLSGDDAGTLRTDVAEIRLHRLGQAREKHFGGRGKDEIARMRLSWYRSSSQATRNVTPSHG